MPTERLNISLVDKWSIEELKKLRKSLESSYQFDDKQISFAEIIKVLLELQPPRDVLRKHF